MYPVYDGRTICDRRRSLDLFYPTRIVSMGLRLLPCAGFLARANARFRSVGNLDSNVRRYGFGGLNEGAYRIPLSNGSGRTVSFDGGEASGFRGLYKASEAMAANSTIRSNGVFQDGLEDATYHRGDRRIASGCTLVLARSMAFQR